MKTKRKIKAKRNVKYYHTRLSQDKIHFIQSLNTDNVALISSEFKRKYGAPLRESTIKNNLKRKVIKVNKESDSNTSTLQIVAKHNGVEYNLKQFAHKLIIDLVFRDLNND
jgi:hypothetical protein